MKISVWQVRQRNLFGILAFDRGPRRRQQSSGLNGTCVVLRTSPMFLARRAFRSGCGCSVRRARSHHAKSLDPYDRTSCRRSPRRVAVRVRHQFSSTPELHQRPVLGSDNQHLPDTAPGGQLCARRVLERPVQRVPAAGSALVFCPRRDSAASRRQCAVGTFRCSIVPTLIASRSTLHRPSAEHLSIRCLGRQ